MNFRDELQKRILIGDGAMGTLLYSNGIDNCYEELNITHPDRIETIHSAYLEAGADILQSNTYGANYYKLKRYGLEEEVSTINRKGIAIARKAANGKAFVFGTIGASRSFRKSDLDLDEIKRCFREQLYSQLIENPDGLILETYYDLEELEMVLKIARNETDLPIIANVSLHETSYLQEGIHLNEALLRLEALGADAVGVNCHLGPHHMIRSLEEVPLPKKAFLSVYPNASSLPEYVDGRFVYEAVPDYFGYSAVNLRNQGARIIGGCCGTTPNHIAAVKKALGNIAPIKEKKIIKRKVEVIEAAVKETKKGLYEKAKLERTILVELDPPKKLGIKEFMKGAKALHKAGVDSITLADNSLASPRISNVALGTILKKEIGSEPLMHITCRDRNMIGLQSHLMGLQTLGLNEVLVVTGDPSKIGDFPGATSVYDLSSFDLISLVKQFNEGLSYSGKSLGKRTNFKIAAAFNPNIRHLHKAVERMEKKIACGAQSFLTQPVFSTSQIEDVYEATKHLDTPIFMGIMPLTSTRNAEFIHNEVPGIKLPDTVRKAMASAGNDPIKARAEGIAIAKELVDAAAERFKGIYLITPFLRFELTEELSKYIREVDNKRVVELTANEQ
ncbi:bifunctional homocysteine S-methyltransferase/methylenetetrahydrofolate reductase [Niallia taxi]|uniref:bifunctional homocysteine S-methyltransferase/methylenetetrahydrofolate reductase n=1 Tax=Niallia taxi TaxID=2499688 RepID=UPI00203D7632|nr:bifunctional homocysteine S-methyltransferase/methylenetetrahydrofolate reductase [Niallia taxi]MCM3213367.1 bifunctional homocysteine S-methyltransferase/methylenetetrahydrofolate reductase [Niallia taxi]MDK8640587.1 bifunctional homocysteine S-methyltransferase/methylenetetrahydrofolate reductase [Niallia taxi]MED4056599.1 bifunctional homocysteine S-methyltransferase/methylenetetrahydrofolate reductase [Niallia taxi]MED4118759.1 bifunctional homocysteine S-methyltransferase/methylenetetra